MKSLALLLLFQIFCLTSKASLQYTNLDILWKASRHPWPKELWTYQMAPTKFSAGVISNLLSLGNFTEKDRWYSTINGVSYSASGRNLRISFAEGEIQYDGNRPHYSATNLAVDVPETNQLFELTTNFLPQLGINFSEILKTKKGQLQIKCYQPAFTEYYANQNFITNIEYRTASFGRLIDNVECNPTVGSCTFYFGEHSQIMDIELFWRNVERDKLYAAATPKQIVQWIREGKAILPKERYIGMGSTEAIDWSTVKTVTITKATACYGGEFFLGEREHRPIFPSPVMPYAVLQATVDTGHGNFDVQINCPIIDESKPLKSGG